MTVQIRTKLFCCALLLSLLGAIAPTALANCYVPVPYFDSCYCGYSTGGGNAWCQTNGTTCLSGGSCY